MSLSGRRPPRRSRGPGLRVRILAGCVAGLLILVLTGCYLPLRFDAEIEVNRAGYYSMVFDGYLTEPTLYRDIAAGALTAEKENARVARLSRDITRDSAVKSFDYVERGIFKLRWEKSGDLTRTRMVTFLRRNEAMLTLSYVRDTGVVTVRGGGIGAKARQQIADAGLNVEGELRLITDARVTEHNATRIRELGGPRKMYIWRIRSVFDPTPKLTLIPG
jgi:hypothetical protein